MPYLPQTKEAPGIHSLSDAANDRCKTSRNGEETQGAASGSTNQLLNHNTQEGQGSKQRGRHRPEQEREAGPEGFPGATRPNQGARKGQVHQGPPLVPEAQGETEGFWTPPGAAHGRDLARQRAINSARPHWQRCLDGFVEKPEEERDPPGAGAVKEKGIQGQEPSGSSRGTPTVQPAVIQEAKRQRAQTQGKYGQGVSADRPPKESQGVGALKSLQEQKHTASIRRAYPSQPKDAPEAKRQAGAGL